MLKLMCAAVVMSKLNKRVWSKTNLTEIYQTICLPDVSLALSSDALT